MAKRRDLRSVTGDDGVDRLKDPRGYVLGEERRVEDVIATDAELLRSEGIDPVWPGLGDGRPESRSGR